MDIPQSVVVACLKHVLVITLGYPGIVGGFNEKWEIHSLTHCNCSVVMDSAGFVALLSGCGLVLPQQ